MTKCPVCGMMVDERQPPASTTHQGEVYHFCSRGCWLVFEREPERWLGQPASGRTPAAARPSGEPLIKIRDLTKTYQRGSEVIQALREVTFDIFAGEFVTVMGPSGGGKSTLLHLVGGIDRPDAGQILVEGQDIVGLSEESLTRYRRENIGFVFQFYNLLPTLTALENVELPLIALSFRRKGRRTMAAELLDVVGLGDRLDHKPSELSGGEQQRVAIARAVVANPKIVLADEPTGDLDSASSDGVVKLMEDLNRSLALTFLIVTHNPAVGERGRRTLYLKDGQIVADERRDGRR